MLSLYVAAVSNACLMFNDLRKVMPRCTCMPLPALDWDLRGNILCQMSHILSQGCEKKQISCQVAFHPLLQSLQLLVQRLHATLIKIRRN